MTHLIDRLAMRALGALPVVRPVPRPRFAAAPVLGGHNGRDDPRVIPLVPLARDEIAPLPDAWPPPMAVRAR